MTTDTLIMVDDTDSGINYSAGWIADKGSHDNMGNYGAPYESTSHYTKGTGTLSYTFSGTYVGIVGSDLSQNNPSRTCTVDGQTISSYVLTFGLNFITHCEIDGLADEKHTIEVTVTAPNPDGYWFDFLMYLPSTSVSRANAALMIDSDDSSITYGSGWAQYAPGNIATENGATMSIQFTGRCLTWLGFYLSQLPAAPTTATYSVDGGSSFMFDLDGSPAQSAGAVFNQRFFTTGLLPAGQHTIKVTYNGNSNTVPLSLFNVIVQNGNSAGVSVGGSIGASFPTTATSNSGGESSPTISSGSGSSGPSSLSSSVVVMGTGTSAVTVTLGNTNSTATTLPSGSGPSSGAGSSSTQSGSGAVSSRQPSSGEPSSTSGTPSDSHPGNSGNLGNGSSATSKSHSHVGIIVGVVVGALALLFLLFLLFFLRRRSQKRREIIDPSNPNNVQPFTSPPTSVQASMSQVSHASPQLYSDNKRPVTAGVGGVGPASPDARNTQYLAPNKPWRWHQTRSSQPTQQPSDSTFSTPGSGSSGPTEPGVIVLHEDSGVRLPDGTVRPGVTVMEMPPTYSAT